ncbi:MAG: glycosyltransferase family 4 protein [Alphaproteobacteria bacterium]|nr:glycosyltransferase family 4 protein [Alphaproteobacteria bacterium]
MTPPRVLFLAHGHPALVPGGTEILAHDLFSAWKQAGHPGLFVGCVTPAQRDARQAGIFQAVGPSADEMLVHVAGFDPFLFAQTEPASFVQGFGELLRRFEPDVVHLHHLALLGSETLALIRAVRPTARIVLTLHDYALICANEGLMTTTGGALCDRASPDACRGCFPAVAPDRFELRRLHLQRLLGLVDAFVAPSRFLRDRYVAWGLPQSRLHVIGNAVPAATPAAETRTGKRPIVGVFGNQAPHKGVLLALEAARSLADIDDFRLRLHGETLYREPGFLAALDRAKAEAGPAVQIDGPYRRDQLGRLMAAVDWVLVPSTWWENAPLVILEAFRHGRPVIAADIGGMAELVQHESNGLLFRARDAHDLARTLRRAVGDERLWPQLAAGIASPPTPAQLADRHAELYAALPTASLARSA